jgi:hypothetical protein
MERPQKLVDLDVLSDNDVIDSVDTITNQTNQINSTNILSASAESTSRCSEDFTITNTIPVNDVPTNITITNTIPVNTVSPNCVFKTDVQKVKDLSVTKNRNTNLAEEIELMKLCDSAELYQLVTTDPEYYINIIEKHKESELSNKFNLLPSRQNNQLMIKFKIYPEDRWTEVGYFAEKGKDQEVYEELVTRIGIELDRPRPKKKKGDLDSITSGARNHLTHELGAHNDIQSDQFRSRDSTAQKSPDFSDKSCSDMKRDLYPDIPFGLKVPIKPMTDSSISSPVNTIQLNEITNVIDDKILPSKLLLNTYIDKILDSIFTRVHDWLEIPKINSHNTSDHLVNPAFAKVRDACPMYLRPKFDDMVCMFNESQAKTATDKAWASLLREIVCTTAHEQQIIDNFIEQDLPKQGQISLKLFEPDFSHAEIVRRLALSETDVSILKMYNVNLLSCWNNCGWVRD